MILPFNRLMFLPAFVGIFVAPAACLAQSNPFNLETGPVEDPALDPVNSDVVSESVDVLVLRLEIHGDDAEVTDVRLSSAPVRMVRFSRDPRKIVVEVLNRAGERVGQTSAGDRRQYARDGELVIVDDRSVSVIVPILARPDKIGITVPGAAPQPLIEVRAMIAGVCRDFPERLVCTTDDPEGHRYFDRLRSGDP